MIGLDTSVVVRLLIGAPAPQAEAARRLLVESKAAVVISDLVVSESYFALRHHYSVPHAEAVAALRALLGDARVTSTGVASRVLTEIADTDPRPGLMDRLIHGDYLAAGATFATFDADAARLEGASLLTS